MKLYELAGSNGDGGGDFNAGRLHDLFVQLILNTATLSGKDKIKFREALEQTDTEMGAILSTMKEIVSWYEDDADDIELSDGWYEATSRPGFGSNDLRMDNSVYQAISSMYDDATTRAGDDFPHEKRFQDKLPDMKTIIKKICAEYPMFAVAVKHGESNFNKVKSKYKKLERLTCNTSRTFTSDSRIVK